MSTPPYPPSFFVSQRDSSLRSARRVAPVVVDTIHPASLLDVGGGTGTWASAFRELGVEDVLLVDGEYVDRSALLVPSDCFRSVDLMRPLNLGRTFDLAVCLEVGEHLPAEAGESLVESLTRHAPAVLFGAAIPGQGGTHHVNEQWQSWWAGLFAGFGYECVDLLRVPLWNDDDVAPHYRQNTLLYATVEWLGAHRRVERSCPSPLDVVHPRLFDLRIRDLAKVRGELAGVSLATVLRKLPMLLKVAAARRLRSSPTT